MEPTGFPNGASPSVPTKETWWTWKASECTPTSSKGTDGKTLVLDHVCCSSYGELEECHGTHCPLRDPAFLRSYDLHGAHTSDGGFEQFIEVESPPEPRWWQEKLRLAKKIG